MIFALSIFVRYLLKPLTTLAIRLREIDFYNFKPIEISHISSNDERALISNSIKVMFDKIDSTLDELNSLNRLLESKVEQKTRELNELNLDLKRQVELEVKKNRDKDKVMFQQARLAQMGEMIGNIAHQWRQPLNEIALVIQSFELAQLKGDLSEEFIENRVQKANHIIKSMSSTIDDFRNFFDPNRKKRLFSLKESIKKAIFMVKASFENNSIKLLENLESDAEFMGFENEFEQVILNILSNAKDTLIDRATQNREVKISLRVEGSIFIDIIDSGGGIDLDIIDRIFEPYFTTKEQGKGSGIGLYMSKQILKNMRGDISVSNIDGGAKFLITLPIEESL
jgi:C4-dicarboxylate-specific signal transduction histidine kinase